MPRFRVRAKLRNCHQRTSCGGAQQITASQNDWNSRFSRNKIGPSERQSANPMAKAKSRRRSFDVKVFLNTVDGGRSVSSYRKNQKIFAQGRCSGFGLLRPGRSGQAERHIGVRERSGRRPPREKEHFFGEGCLSGQSLRLATAAAMTDCVIMRLDKAAIVRVLREEPKFSEMFCSLLNWRGGYPQQLRLRRPVLIRGAGRLPRFKSQTANSVWRTAAAQTPHLRGRRRRSNEKHRPLSWVIRDGVASDASQFIGP